MSGYSVDVRTGILTGNHNLHTWIQITNSDGSKEAWGFYPATDSLGNVIYGAGDLKPEDINSAYTASSGPLLMTDAQAQVLKGYIAAVDANPPNYSVISLPGGIQCSMWSVIALQNAGIVPAVMSPAVTPESLPLIDALIWNPLWQSIGFSIYDSTSSFFQSARAWVQRRDPLTLDLDGDGLETVGIDPANPILFDHDGDGVKNATGWIKGDDGFLALDRNGNGLIDDGSELFGDSTPLATGGKAEDGFAALAQEDTNGDGLVNAEDAHWNELRVWQDTNSNGLTDEGELKILESLGIAGFHVGKTEHTARLANGNVLADLGSYIKTDGSEATLGNVTGAMAGSIGDDMYTMGNAGDRVIELEGKGTDTVHTRVGTILGANDAVWKREA